MLFVESSLFASFAKEIISSGDGKCDGKGPCRSLPIPLSMRV